MVMGMGMKADDDEGEIVNKANNAKTKAIHDIFWFIC